MSVARSLWVTLAALALVALVAVLRYASPTPRGPEPGRFSAVRAHEVQARLCAFPTRTIGTEGNERGRALITAELASLGWTVETQSALTCTSYGVCAPVTNILGRRAGREQGIVLVSAHHDSAPVSPGAGDDGFGAATLLETARVLSEGPQLRRTVVVLFTDGEESGLLGADEFVRHHPISSMIHASVNLDSRGSRGPSQMFETSRGNAAVVDLMAAHLDRPVTASLFYEVYKRLPNDTDFTLTKKLAPGVNFANTGGIEYYHTPLDRIDVASLGTLQHHGDHVLGMTRAFADEELSGDRSNAVWFDVLAFGIVHVPERAMLPAAVFALVLMLFHAFRGRPFDRALGVFFAMLVAGVLATMAIGWALKATGAVVAPWMAHPDAALAAIHAGALAASLGVWCLLSTTPRSLWAGTWVGWGIVGVAVAVFAPGASYLFVVPVLAAGVVGAFALPVATIVPALTAAVLTFALGTSLYEALGFAMPPVVALPTVLTATTLAPLLSGLPRPPRVALCFGAAAVVGVVVALVVPKFSASHPQRVNVVFRQDDGGEGRVFIDSTWGPAFWGPAPAAMVKAVSASARASAFPWSPPTPYGTVAPIEARAPVLEDLEVRTEDGHRVVRGRLRSLRGATTLGLFIPRGRAVTSRVEGHDAPRRNVPGGTLLVLLAVPASRMIELRADGTEPITVTLFDRTAGVPPQAEPAVRARGVAATAFQDGDVTIRTSSPSL